MLTESKLYSFIDDDAGYAVTFFEGQKLVSELALLNEMTPQGFSYFRESVLTVQPMIAFLKHGEGMGIYIDSEEPYFRLKIETNESGAVRTLLLPEEFCESPKEITGVCRLSKIFGNGNRPYTSVIQLNQLSFKEIVNKILSDSYQIKCKIFVSDESDQSVMLMKLPNKDVNSTLEGERLSVEEYWLKNKAQFTELFKKGTTENDIIVSTMEAIGMTYLKGKEVKFTCPCTKERMILGIKGLSITNTDQLFDEGMDTLETKCDYCKEAYLIAKSDLI
ncbi:MAG: Hsp33 family molecular chaperone HslO [Bacteriovoracaceae bacterium]|nr:Hsp33 family molecular chaperone HslO [Bacteriovoracaceae bacterium]